MPAQLWFCGDVGWGTEVVSRRLDNRIYGNCSFTGLCISNDQCSLIQPRLYSELRVAAESLAGIRDSTLPPALLYVLGEMPVSRDHRGYRIRWPHQTHHDSESLDDVHQARSRSILAPNNFRRKC